MTDDLTPQPPSDCASMDQPPAAQVLQRSREQADWITREEILDAAGDLLSELQALGFHYTGVDTSGWLRAHPTGTVIHVLLDAISAARKLARDAEADVTDAIAQYEWLQGGGPLRCMGCGRDIDPDEYVWAICDGLPEHDVCTEYDPALRARNWAATVAEDEHQAYCEDRIRCGGPRSGDVVEVADPGGDTIEGVWETDGDLGGGVRVSGGPGDGAYVAASSVDVVRVVRLVGDCPSPRGDGHPLADDVARYGATCDACRQPLVPGLPAVWLSGRPAHRACAIAAGITVTGPGITKADCGIAVTGR